MRDAACAGIKHQQREESRHQTGSRFLAAVRKHYGQPSMVGVPLLRQTERDAEALARIAVSAKEMAMLEPAQVELGYGQRYAASDLAQLLEHRP